MDVGFAETPLGGEVGGGQQLTQLPDVVINIANLEKYGKAAYQLTLVLEFTLST